MNFLKCLFKRLLIYFEYLIFFNLIDGQKEGIVLIRLDAIGDFMLWLDSAKEYRKIYPHQKITLVANASWADMANNLQYWDEVWPVNLTSLRSNLPYRWGVLRKIRRANFKIAIQPTYSRVLLYGDSLIRATNAMERIGSCGDIAMPRGDIAIGNRWYTTLLPADPGLLMELLRNTEFIQNLSQKSFSAGLPIWPVQEVGLKQLMLEGDYAILFPGASWHGRRWPQKSFIEVANYLNKQLGLQLVLCGASSDFTDCQEIADAVPEPCLNLAGKTTLIELAEIIRNSKLLIANETSALHIAVAVGAPTICILGGGHFGRFAPYPANLHGIKAIFAVHSMSCFNCNWQCSRPHTTMGPVSCISEVTVAKVIGMVPQALEFTR